MAMQYFTYKVPPFSGPRYGDRSSHHNSGEEPCAICGKPIKNLDDHPYWGIATSRGTWATAWTDGDMGAFPVGNDCHRKHVDRQIEPED